MATVMTLQERQLKEINNRLSALDNLIKPSQAAFERRKAELEERDQRQRAEIQAKLTEANIVLMNKVGSHLFEKSQLLLQKQAMEKILSNTPPEELRRVIAEIFQKSAMETATARQLADCVAHSLPQEVAGENLARRIADALQADPRNFVCRKTNGANGAPHYYSLAESAA